jgi:hypothetical protein
VHPDKKIIKKSKLCKLIVLTGVKNDTAHRRIPDRSSVSALLFSAVKGCICPFDQPLYCCTTAAQTEDTYADGDTNLLLVVWSGPGLNGTSESLCYLFCRF